MHSMEGYVDGYDEGGMLSQVDQRHTSRKTLEGDDMLLLGQSKTIVTMTCYRLAAIEDMHRA